jgi:hypothetical protein
VVAFVDTDGDGGRDVDERFLAGVTLRLTHVRSGAFINRTTDGTNDPDYCWDGLINGDYSLGLVTLPAGYQATGPTERHFTVPFPGPPAHYSFGSRRGPAPTASPTPPPTLAPTDTPAPTATATEAPTVTGPAGDLCVTVFHDRDASRFPEAGEALLADRRVTVLDEDRQPAREVLSRADGPVCMRLAVGVYYARTSPAPGWVATTAEEQAALVTQNGAQALAFGQRRTREPGQVYLPLVQRPRDPTGPPSALPPRGGRAR